MIKWFKNKMVWLMLALQKTESNIMNDRDEILLVTGKYQSHKQGMLSHSLVNGELTEEVKELRWRIYKIIDHTQGVRAEIVGYKDDGTPIVNTTRSHTRSLKGFKGDPTDDLPTLMVVTNRPMDIGTIDALGSVNGETQDISGEDYFTKFKSAKSIFIKRENTPLFELEKYTTKLVVKEIQKGEEFLMEFYVSKYPDMDDRRSRLFLSEVKKVMDGKHNSSVTDFNSVMFISDRTMGVKDFLEFEFGIDCFDKITEYKGDYVIKFKAHKVVYGDDVLDKYKIDSLETKYENKEKK